MTRMNRTDLFLFIEVARAKGDLPISVFSGEVAAEKRLIRAGLLVRKVSPSGRAGVVITEEGKLMIAKLTRTLRGEYD